MFDMLTKIKTKHFITKKFHFFFFLDPAPFFCCNRRYTYNELILWKTPPANYSHACYYYLFYTCQGALQIAISEINYLSKIRLLNTQTMYEIAIGWIISSFFRIIQPKSLTYVT